MNSLKQRINDLHAYLICTNYSPLSLMLSTGLIAFLYAFSEWVFIITKPSAFTTIPGYEKWLILLNSASLLVLASLILVLPLYLYYLFFRKIPHHIFLNLFAIIPTFILATLALMLIDNFTYTVFNFGIVSATGKIRIVYTILYAVLLILLYKPVLGFTRFVDEVRAARPIAARRFSLTAIGILLVLGILLPLLMNPTQSGEASESITQPGEDALPNILLITVDGLNATNTSLYGFELETTPFLEQLATSSLFAENAFANAQGTLGSTSAILTGKYPVDLKILYSNEVLKGIDATQHLPGLLKSYGYTTVQLAYSHYADAYTHNLQGAFDEASGRTSPSGGWLVEKIGSIFPTDFKVFLQEALERPYVRLGHIFFALDMDNPYKQVTEGIAKTSDVDKVERALTVLRESGQPAFIHLHWMGTHGPKYYPGEQVFSKGKSVDTQGKYENEFYYDSILDFDRNIEKLYATLEQEGLLENTVIILTSDHTQKWSNGRILMLMHFPEDEYAQSITPNVQQIDIAPTLLDYIGISQPSWMPGDSLLNGMSEMRPIVTAKIPKSIKDPVTGKVSYPKSTEPFYQFGRMSVILCNTWYELDTTDLIMTSGKIKGHTADCGTESGSMQDALDELTRHFEEYGYDASTLPMTIFKEE